MKSLDEQLKSLGQRWQGKKRCLVVKTDGFGHFWIEWSFYEN